MSASAEPTKPLIQFDPERDAGPVPSPCISICRLHPQTGWCEGCQRRLEEIGAWSGLNDSGRRAVWRRILARRASAAEQAD